ncbi:MAG TPA: aspartyl protease family protein, partial [Acetobacteraceae bacterium]|nr:aspartyl protease family protein [Acetobacteraceae bacterium]
MRQILTLILSIVLAGTAKAACQIEPHSSVPVELINGNMLVTVQVNDAPALFILDTGAERTLMGEEAVRGLNLERDSWVASAIRGLGGIEERPN